MRKCVLGEKYNLLKTLTSGNACQKHIPSWPELIFFSCKYNYNIKWVPRSSLRSSFPISSARVTWVVSWTTLQHSHFQGLQNNNNSNNSYPEHCLIPNWFFKWIPFYWSDEERVKRPPLQVLWPKSHPPGFQRGSQSTDEKLLLDTSLTIAHWISFT